MAWPAVFRWIHHGSQGLRGLSLESSFLLGALQSLPEFVQKGSVAGELSGAPLWTWPQVCPPRGVVQMVGSRVLPWAPPPGNTRTSGEMWFSSLHFS